jgi:hypothetical protein
MMSYRRRTSCFFCDPGGLREKIVHAKPQSTQRQGKVGKRMQSRVKKGL